MTTAARSTALLLAIGAASLVLVACDDQVFVYAPTPPPDRACDTQRALCGLGSWHPRLRCGVDTQLAHAGESTELGPLPSDGLADASIDDRATAVTDNYKAYANADPTAPELRTWLAFRSIASDGERLLPAVRRTQVAWGIDMVRAEDDRRRPVGKLIAYPDSPLVVTATMRYEPRLGIGPLVSLRRPLERGERVRVDLVLEGTTTRKLSTEYRWDERVATTRPGAIEWNTAGGRWFVGSASGARRTPLGTEC